MNRSTLPLSHGPLRRLACRALVLPLVLAAAVGRAQAAGTGAALLERRVKAAFLYKFLGYTEFPPHAFADAATPVTLGVIGSHEMAAELARIVAGRNAGGRALLVRALDEGDVTGTVHLLFVAGDGPRIGRALRAVPGALLTVTEAENGLQHGSIINFRIVDDRVRFDVSLDAAERNNVRLSSRLLSVANRVQKGAA